VADEVELSGGDASLRLYQVRDVEEIETRLARGEHVIYVLPTGGGKTVIAARVIERAVERGERVLVLTHRREILKQTSLKLPVDHGLILAGLNDDLSYPIQVASIQTLHARAIRSDKLTLPAADLLVIDESHHVAARTWRTILEQYPNARLLGLTATPCRSDGKGLGNYFNTLIEGPQVAELIEQKHLTPTIYYAPVEPDLKGIKTQAGDYQIKQLAERMNRDDLIGDIVSTWHRYGQRRRTIVFCVNVAHSIHVMDEFVKSGVRAEHLDGATPKTERDAILQRLASGETEVVTNCMVLIEGVDIPSVSCIVLARPTKQLGLFRQMAGRGLRPAPDKTNLILLDHAGAVYRHGLLEDKVQWTLDITKRADNPTHAKCEQRGVKRLLECIQCHALREGGEPCPQCGFQPKRRADAILFADGELARVEAGKKAQTTYSPAERTRWHAMLAGIALERGYKQGWAAHKYKEKFGAFPAWGSSPQPMTPSPEVLSWVRSRQIAFAKVRQKENAA
jgi:superfamily II DNA or RNA helicase